MKIVAMGALGLRIGLEAFTFQDEADFNDHMAQFFDRHKFPTHKTKTHCWPARFGNPRSASTALFLNGVRQDFLHGIRRPCPSACKTDWS